MCVGVLPACISMSHMYAMPTEVRKGYQIPRKWSYRQLRDIYGFRNQTLIPFEEQPELLPVGPYLQSLSGIF